MEILIVLLFVVYLIIGLICTEFNLGMFMDLINRHDELGVWKLSLIMFISGAIVVLWPIFVPIILHIRRNNSN